MDHHDDQQAGPQLGHSTGPPVDPHCGHWPSRPGLMVPLDSPMRGPTGCPIYAAPLLCPKRRTQSEPQWTGPPMSPKGAYIGRTYRPIGRLNKPPRTRPDRLTSYGPMKMGRLRVQCPLCRLIYAIVGMLF